MSSLVIDLVLCGLAYVILIYFVATLTRNSLKKRDSNGDDGDGGVEDMTPPKIDLPPGVIWPSDVPRGSRTEPVEF
ncbi:hypothetical protein JYB62_15435 [Algoriphagus lutimaris]|uniref:Uncharacterized protein n=1 Tax=Algoriphagus halophilus TaxID=226505 RepID=A0A1N6GLJ9_9BACT|nr:MULTISPECIES: hypothetical protein [Algoriphagus]MBN3521402.1 hypothetical protein [Algoriphagus lutimaris]SIO08403.1 hypothetical protein SAMN05444394_3347 [Algoriphagus halophilus]